MARPDPSGLRLFAVAHDDAPGGDSSNRKKRFVDWFFFVRRRKQEPSPNPTMGEHVLLRSM